MIVLVFWTPGSFREGSAAAVVEGFTDATEAGRWVIEHPLPSGWRSKAFQTLSPNEAAEMIMAGRESGATADGPETAARGAEELVERLVARDAVEYVTPRALADRIRKDADDALLGLAVDDPAAVVDALTALRLELRASTVEILDLGKDVVGALERVGLGE